MSSYANSSAIESASMGYQKYREGGRAKWGSYLFDSFSKDSGRNSKITNGPTWLEKRLNQARDSEEETMSISVQSVSSFLRGQNVPLDPMDLAERESKRRKAMDLQNAIKEQLLERENIKKMKKEKQWQQEKLEKERLAKQMELELQRLELDRQLQNEKLQNERMRQEAMRLALEKAAFEAQFDRERKKRERTLANSLDETICIQKVGQKTEMLFEDFQTSNSEKHATTDYNESATEKMSQITVPQQKHKQHHDDDEENEEDDGETMLIGTPIKLKKKNLDNYRKKLFAKRQQQADNSKSTSDEDVSTLKCNTLFSDTSSEKSTIRPLPQKTLSDLDGIALVLQTMPMVPFVPLSNDVFALNQYNFNNLALLMASQHNRLNAQNMMFPFTTSLDEKLDFNKLPASLPISTPIPNISANQIQQTTPKTPYTETDERPIRSASLTPDQQLLYSERDYNLESAVNQLNISVTNKITSINESAKNDFVLEATKLIQEPVEQETKTIGTQDAFTSTMNENSIIQEPPQQEIKILTPKKYRDVKQPLNSITIGTQTESSLYCDYCFFQKHKHYHQQHNCNVNFSEEVELTSSLSNQEVNKLKDKNKIEGRPRWGSRVPPIKYVKASDKDPFYASMKNRKKRYMKKSNKYEDGVCNHKDCTLVSIKTSAPLLNRRFVTANNKNFCSDMLPIKTDKNGRVYLLHEENFIINEALRKHNHQQTVFNTIDSDNESILDVRNNFRNSLKLNDRICLSKEERDFQDIFVE